MAPKPVLVMPRESGGIQYSSGIGDYLNRRGVLDRLVKPGDDNRSGGGSEVTHQSPKQ